MLSSIYIDQKNNNLEHLIPNFNFIKNTFMKKGVYEIMYNTSQHQISVLISIMISNEVVN